MKKLSLVLAFFTLILGSLRAGTHTVKLSVQIGSDKEAVYTVAGYVSDQVEFPILVRDKRFTVYVTLNPKTKDRPPIITVAVKDPSPDLPAGLPEKVAKMKMDEPIYYADFPYSEDKLAVFSGPGLAISLQMQADKK